MVREIARVNEVLNLYRLGAVSHVIDKCNEILLMSSRFTEKIQNFWNVVHLPLGMCYYELNKPSLALEHLKLAKTSIDQSDLFHMYGLIELYLFKSYYILNDSSGMDSIKSETVDAEVNNLINGKSIKGAVVSIVKDDQVLLFKGYGFADEETNLKADEENTAFRIGSITKTFVALAAMQLVEQGKLDLNTPITKYLEPDFPKIQI